MTVYMAIVGSSDYEELDKVSDFCDDLHCLGGGSIYLICRSLLHIGFMFFCELGDTSVTQGIVCTL